MISNKVELSIIIPVYNTGKYLMDTFASILYAKNNSNASVEVIFVDDHSNVETKNILKQLLEYNFVKVITLSPNEPKGAGNARNIGMDNSTKNHLYFMDADDKIDVNFFEKISNFVLNSEFDILTFGFIMIEATTGKVINKVSPIENKKIFSFMGNDEALSWYFANVNVFSVWNKIYSKKFILENKLRFPNNRTAQDAIFNLTLLSKSPAVEIIPDSLYHYLISRPGSNQTVLKSKFMDEYEVLLALKSAMSELNIKHSDEVYYDQVIEILTREYKFALSQKNNEVIVTDLVHFTELSRDLMNFYRKVKKRKYLKYFVRNFFFTSYRRINFMGWIERHV